MKQYIKTDRNGTKYFLTEKKCPRCGGRGGSDAWKYTDWTCWQCGGLGIIDGTEIIKEYTPEYAAKREAKRMAKMAEEQARIAAEMARIAEERAKIEAEEKARREAEEKAEAERKARSQYIGSIGEKIEIDVTFDHMAWYEIHNGWMTTKMFIYNFVDDQGNKIVWKTSSGLHRHVDDGEHIRIKGTIKDHSEYKDEKQTSIIRVKIIE